MSYEEFAADLTPFPSIRFHCIEECEEALRRLGIPDFEARQLGRGSFRSDLAAIRTTEGIALSQRFERNFYSPLHTPEGMVTLLITTTAGGDLLASGDIVSNGKLIVQTPKSEIDLVAPDLTASHAFGVPVSRFYSMLDSICPGGFSIQPDQMVVVKGDTIQLNRLRQAIFDLVTHPDLDPQHERQANLIAEVIAWVGDSSSQWRPEGFPVNGARIRIARKAQEYLEDHFPKPIRMEDVCREIGVGLRTMQRAFAEYLQMSPYDYLKKLRLDRARRALLAAESGTHRVTTVALDHGFRHMGRFSREYRATFGEYPKQTLSKH